jgi:hypothetical protein
VSEGEPEGWAAIAMVTGDDARELGWRQRELAQRSNASVAAVWDIQRHTAERRRSPRTLESLSAAHRCEPRRLTAVLNRDTRLAQAVGRVANDGAVRSRLDLMERRLDGIGKLLAGLRADFATVMDHVCHQR